MEWDWIRYYRIFIKCELKFLVMISFKLFFVYFKVLLVVWYVIILYSFKKEEILFIKLRNSIKMF